MGTPLDDARYINLRSFRRDGSGADTPVWAAPSDGKLVVFTLRESYKIKRIKRESRVQIARCDARGKLLGPWIDGAAHIVTDAEEEKRAYAALNRKYGLTMRIGTVLSTLIGRARRRVVLDIEVTGTLPAD